MEAEEREVQLKRVQADPGVGLTTEQVKHRYAAHAVNSQVDSGTKSISDIVKSNVFTYFNMIFLILGILLVFVGAWRDLLFLFVIIANTAIGIIQEVHSKKVLDDLSILNAPKTVTVRNGKEEELPSEKLVLDDIILLRAGSQIPADAVVVEGEIQVNESLITGEADEISKGCNDKLMSGSFVVSGEAKARLEQVGKDSYISKLTLQATKVKEGEQSEMIRSLNNLIMVMGIIILPIGIALFAQSYFYNGESLYTSITTMVAAVIGMIPEGLYLLASVAMAVSAVRLAKQEVLIHDMKCIETLARVNVLCVDKTGTITEPGMTVYKMEVVHPLNLRSADKKDSTSADRKQTLENAQTDQKAEELQILLSDFASNMPTDNATMEAMQAYFKQTSGKRAQAVFTFSSETKFSGMIINDASYVLGAPEFILDRKSVV